MKWENYALSFFIGAGLVLILLLWIIPIENNQEDKKSIQKIRELEHHNQMLTKVNAILDDKVFELEIQADSLRTLLIQDKEQITGLKQRKNEKIYHISRYNDDELFRYFSRFNSTSTTDQK
ncbi:hypothetical protein HN014_10770 [Aquimarina sp. TRL1]|uniref:hypothetical protein n=1 Tax=Aquimarina sp. (strain TRL1) TaxID=2736252 RepID=UPI00158C6B85|nr:hypothetical protein [Aquimarina sp. TRL1]QKX05376.1 hypothetical protein HN014_10770 [Aquimarina sp. TRL1]